MSLDPFSHAELIDFQKDQAGRIRDFLTRLANDPTLLRDYINDRVAVLRKEQDAGNLTSEDVALLLDSDYHRVYEVMSKGSAPQRWVVVWVV